MVSLSLKRLRNELATLKSETQAQILRRFFKTGPGEYGYGDKFIGIKVPVLRGLAKKYAELKESDVLKLLQSRIHEERLLAMYIVVTRFQKGTSEEQNHLYNLILQNLPALNNWDIIDTTVPQTIGAYLLNQDKSILQTWAKSANLWHRRIAILATFAFIRKNRYTDTLRIAKMLLQDKEDLIHKAVGWMLREIAKRDLAVEEVFLKKQYRKMPRTMLRYAIEKFPENKRKAYLSNKII